MKLASLMSHSPSSPSLKLPPSAAEPSLTSQATEPASIEAQIGLLEIECKFRQVKVRQAGRMKDVAQLLAIDVRGEMVSRQSEIRGLKQLQISCEQRMRELIGSHLLELRNIRDLGLFQQMRSHYQHREWGFLKGPYPMLFREADSEAERIERNLEREQDQQSKRRRGR
jgi:hypothetical protein